MTPLTPGQALAALLRDLGTEPCRIPEHPDAAAALLRSLLAPTRTLLVLDDAVNAAQVRPLLPGGPGCAVIVTSRSPLTALDGAARFPLAPLSDEESAELLRGGLRAGTAWTDGRTRLVGLTGRLPLALRVVAARLAARQGPHPGRAGPSTGRQPTDGCTTWSTTTSSVRRSLAVAHDALRRLGARGRPGRGPRPAPDRRARPAHVRRPPARPPRGHRRTPHRGRPGPPRRRRPPGGDDLRPLRTARPRTRLRP